MYELDDADLITDEVMGELITWHGGLNRLVGSHGLQSCQALNSDIVPFGTKAVILLSSALFGTILTQLESLLKEQLWSNILIITATSDHFLTASKTQFQATFMSLNQSSRQSRLSTIIVRGI